jgi:penicillin-binding protein 1A
MVGRCGSPLPSGRVARARSLAAEPPASRATPQPARRRWAWALVRWLVILAIWAVLGAGGVLVWFARDLPRPEAALDAERRPGLTLVDRSGHAFANFGDVVGDPLRLSDMPAYLPEAAVSVEDRRFWVNPGIDPIGMARAAWVNLIHGRLLEGGSTITQQVAKNLFLSNARTLKRKVQELMLTVWLAHHFTKREILEIWLNRVYLGSGTWGMDAAARLYFGVSARQVSLWQAAVLAGLPRAPSRINPRADPEAAIARGREVLAAMVETGAITAAQAKEAASQIRFPPPPVAAGWFADWAAEQAQTLVPDGADAVLHTTLDQRMQAVVEARLEAMLAGPGAAVHATQGAVVVLDAATGQVRAMAGGRNYRQSAFNRAVLARRQPGSSFKPFVWLAALEAGARPDDTVLDGPIRVGTWSPADFEPRYEGEVTLEQALADSLNTAAVRLMQQAGGPATVVEVAHRLGVASDLPATPSIALGTGEVGVLEMAGAYASFFNGGLRVTPAGITAIDADRQAITPPPAPRLRVIDPDLAAMMVRMMAAVVTRGTGTAAAIRGQLVAGKTGTTQDSRDAWFIGAANGRVIAVWMGNDDDTPMKGVTGGSLPARLFHDIAVGLPGG